MGTPSRGIVSAIKDNYLTSIVLSEGIRVLDYDAIVSCPNLKDAWSNKAAYLYNQGMDIMTVQGTPIIRDAGSSKKPVINVELESALRSVYADLEGTELMNTYLRIYCRYLLKNTIGITDSMTFNQKVQKIYGYVIARRCKLTTSQFECLADAGCNGFLSCFADGHAITFSRIAFISV